MDFSRPDGSTSEGHRVPADDLGHPWPLRTPARRVVSLVPSLTEACASVRADAVVGATQWCTHPVDLDVARVRGTKNPDVAKVIELNPDAVIANQEENRRIDVERLRAAGINVWVTRTESLDEAFASLQRLFTVALDWPAPPWLEQARQVWAKPATGQRRRVVVPIWRDPWMAVGTPTFTSDMLDRLGFANALAGLGERYPRMSLADLVATAPDLVVLPDEPYAFSPDDGPEAFPDLATVLVEGRLLTWYGPSLSYARADLEKALR